MVAQSRVMVVKSRWDLETFLRQSQKKLLRDGWCDIRREVQYDSYGFWPE